MIDIARQGLPTAKSSKNRKNTKNSLSRFMNPITFYFQTGSVIVSNAIRTGCAVLPG